jgi:hypothetical protein
MKQSEEITLSTAGLQEKTYAVKRKTAFDLRDNSRDFSIENPLQIRTLATRRSVGSYY